MDIIVIIIVIMGCTIITFATLSLVYERKKRTQKSTKTVLVYTLSAKGQTKRHAFHHHSWPNREVVDVALTAGEVASELGN